MSIKTSGTKKVVENSTDYEFVDNNYSLIQGNIIVPVLDKFRFNLKIKLSYSFDDVMILKRSLENHGLRASFHFRQPKKITGISSTVVFTQHNSGCYSVGVVLFGNGHKILEENGYPLGIDLDGYKNVLQQADSYHNQDLLKVQIKALCKAIDDTCQKIGSIFETLKMFAPEWSLEIVDTEFSFHVTVADVHIRHLMLSILNNSRAIYGRVGLVSSKKEHVGKSFHAKADKKFLMKCYQKMGYLIRLEFTLAKETLWGATLSSSELIECGMTELLRFASESQTLFKTLMAFDYKCKEVSFDSALKAFQSHCSKKAFTELYDRLICGDGEIKVKASEGYIYRNLKPLLESGILLRGFAQSEFLLAPQYRKLISEHSTLNQFISSHQSDRNPDSQYQESDATKHTQTEFRQ